MANKTSIIFILIVFIWAVITATLIGSIANQTNLLTNTFSVSNETVTVPSTVNGTLDLTGRDLVTEIEIINATNNTAGNVVPVGLSLQRGFGNSGLLTVQLFANDTASIDLGESVNISYIYNPDGYVNTVGGRAITNLIVLFAALAIVVFIIVMMFGSEALQNLLSMSNRRK